MKKLAMILMITSLLACNEESEPSYKQWEGGVSKAELPAMAKVNEKITILLSYPTRDTCDGFYKATTKRAGNVITVTLVLRRFEEDTCLFVAADKTVPYKITLTEPGAYTFRFYNGTDYTEYPITVD
jgi:hypothetical protein